LYTPHYVGLLWTSDWNVADLYLTTHNTQKRWKLMPLVEFKCAIPVSRCRLMP